jgi:predicted GNAT family N-acyltransferase
MNKENLQLRRLGENDKVATFDCSNSAYNRFRKQFFAQGKMFKSYPALKICRLATSKSCRGEGIGSMMIQTIIASYRNDSKAGCRFITVDAYADALPFYYKQGFIPLSKTDEGADTRLLYFDLQSVNVNE